MKPILEWLTQTTGGLISLVLLAILIAMLTLDAVRFFNWVRNKP